MKSRKSQITIFIAVGIILLISLLVMIYIRSTSVQEKEEAEIQKEATEIPYNVQKAQQFVSGCVEQTAKDAIKKLGMHGGYIDPRDTELSGGVIKLNPDPTESEAVSFTQEGELMIPYWHYMDSPNSCTATCSMSSKKPKLYKTDGEPSIEGQIERYVQKELPKCIDGFRQLKEQGYELVSEKNMSVSAFVTTSGVNVILNYPVELKKGSENIELNKFSTTVDVNLKRIYEFAEELTNIEANQTYIEKYTLNLIAAFSRLDSKRLPPIATTDLDCNKQVSWTLSDVKENKMKPMLMSYIPFLQPFGVLNARFYEDVTDPLQKGLLMETIINVNMTKAFGLKADYAYLGWPIYLDITPRKGEIIEAQSMGVSIFNFCINQYKFAYDLSYPVIVEISDPLAFNEEGYSFQFALESNIRNNEERAVNPKIAQVNREVAYYDTAFQCDSNQLLSGNISVHAKDSMTNQSIQGVKVSFCIPQIDGTCGSDACRLGITDEKGDFASKFPLGDGILLLEKEDYLDYARGLDTEYEQGGSYNATMKQFKELTAGVSLKLMKKTCDEEEMKNIPEDIKVVEVTDPNDKNKKCIWKYQPSQAVNISENDTAIIMLERQQSFSSYQTSIILGKDAQTNKLKLAPGNYTVSINYISGKGLHIPKKEMSCDDCQDLEPIDMEQAFLGGTVLDNSTQYWEVKPEQLYSGKEVEFYAIVPDISQLTEQQDMAATGMTETTSKKFTSEVVPQIR